MTRGLLLLILSEEQPQVLLILLLLLLKHYFLSVTLQGGSPIWSHRPGDGTHTHMQACTHTHTLTLSSDDDDGKVGAAGVQLAEQLVQLQEAGLVLQAEDQEDGVYPAAELQGGRGGRGKQEWEEKIERRRRMW